MQEETAIWHAWNFELPSGFKPLCYVFEGYGTWCTFNPTEYQSQEKKTHVW